MRCAITKVNWLRESTVWTFVCWVSAIAVSKAVGCCSPVPFTNGNVVSIAYLRCFYSVVALHDHCSHKAPTTNNHVKKKNIMLLWSLRLETQISCSYVSLLNVSVVLLCEMIIQSSNWFEVKEIVKQFETVNVEQNAILLKIITHVLPRFYNWGQTHVSRPFLWKYV